MPAADGRATKARAPKGAVVKNPVKDGHVYALRFTAYGKRQYVTLGRPDEGWTDKRAEEELQRVLAEVRDGTWSPWQPADEPEPEPTFHAFASQWFDANKDGWREATRLDYEWQLVAHLLPFFKDHRLSEITIAEVDRYRESKLRENRRITAAAAKGKPIMVRYTDKLGRKCARPDRPLSPASINKTLTRLGQILEVAVERDLIGRNPVRVNPRKRRANAKRPDRVYLDRAQQIEALLDAATQMDRNARKNGRIARRALLATLVFSGLRISEALDLRWRDVELANARLRIRASKTDAGVRTIDLLPVLLDELSTLKARTPDAAPNSPVFVSAAGTRMDRNRVRNRVLAPAIVAADKALDEAGFAPLPEGLTLHGLRRTYCSILAALNRSLPYVMESMGHTGSAVTFIYMKSMRDEDRAALRRLVGEDEANTDPVASAVSHAPGHTEG